MTKDQAEFIAARVPGAKPLQGDDRQWMVRARCAAGERITLEDDGRLYLEPDDRRGCSKNAPRFNHQVASFTSALADARAVGILPAND